MIVIGTLATLGLFVAAFLTPPPYFEERSSALPLHLWFGGLGVAVLSACAAWTVRVWANPRTTGGAALRGLMATAGSMVASGIGELAIHEATQHDARAELHGLMVLVPAAAVLVATGIVMDLHARRAAARARPVG